jgi:hypothetical protein
MSPNEMYGAYTEEIRPNGPDLVKSAPENVGSGNVDKIRDILFGSQMREYEARFARLEENLLKEATDVRETTRRRIDSLEAFLHKEFESLHQRLKTERDERSDSHKRITQDLRDSFDSITRKIADVEDHTSSTHGDLRRDALNQTGVLREELRVLKEEMASVLDRRVHELRTGKTDRAALATLFNEVAMKLNDEFQLPHD